MERLLKISDKSTIIESSLEIESIYMRIVKSI